MRAKLLPGRPRAPYYGWYIVGAALVAQFIQVGTQAYATGIFLRPMTDDLGWSRQSFSAVQTVSTAVMGGIGLLIGAALDRRGPRLLMVMGGIIAGGSMMSTSMVHSLWQFYLVRGVAQTVGMALFGNLVVNVTVARWFVARRGIAIAASSIGISLGGVLIVPLASWLVGEYGWRTAWALLGLLVWALVLPSALIMRRTPEDSGLLPDGMTAEEAAAYTARTKRVSAASEVHWTRREAMGTKALWLIIVGYGIGTVSTTGLLLHAVPMLSDHGFSRGSATALFSVWAWAALLAKAIWGPLMDRFHPRYLSAVGFLLGAVALIGLVVSVRAGNAALVALSFATYGLGRGGTAPLQESVWASYFGRIHLGEIRAVAMPFSIIFSAGGPLLGGALYDRTGSYSAALLIFAIFSAVGCLLVLLASPPKLRRGHEAPPDQLAAGTPAPAPAVPT